MALAFDAASGAKADNGTLLSFAHTCTGSDRVLIVTAGALGFPPAAAITGITYAGVAMTQAWSVAHTQVDSLEMVSEGWYLIAPATGSNNVVVSFNSADELWASATSFTGADQSVPLGTPVTGQAASVTPSVTVSSAPGEIVIDGLRAGQPTITVGAGQTSRNEQENINFSSAGGSSTEPGAASVTMSWSLGAGGYGNFWALGAVAVKPVSGSIGLGAGSASGTGTATGVGASIAAATASSTGTGSVNGIGAATTAATASSTGASTVNGIGASTSATTGSSTGIGIATGISDAAITISATASASGTSTAKGVSAQEEEQGAGGTIFRPLPMLPLQPSVIHDVTVRVAGVSVHGRINPPVIITGTSVRVLPSAAGRSARISGVQVRTVRNPTREQLEALLQVI